MFIREIKENDDPMEIMKDWSAYRRQKRQEREQRVAVMIVSLGLVAGVALLVCSFVVKVRREAAESAALVEMIGGAK